MVQGVGMRDLSSGADHIFCVKIPVLLVSCAGLDGVRVCACEQYSCSVQVPALRPRHPCDC